MHTELTESEYTPYKRIYRLLPGHRLGKNKDQSLLTEKYWSMNRLGKNNATLDDPIGFFANILQNIVHESVSNQKVIGCEVSGGLDSSSIS